MSDTKENILTTALSLFAQNGYEAVSVSMIAGELGVTKGALYKHYKNKRDIFNSIVERMYQLDTERAKKYCVPQGTLDEMSEEYKIQNLIILFNLLLHNLIFGQQMYLLLIFVKC